MSEAYLGEVRMVASNFAPNGWMLCDGALLPISQNTALFSLLGTNFGGNGTTNFGLPNLSQRMPMHVGQGPGLSNHGLGEMGGETTHLLTQPEMPAHSHTLQGTSAPANFNPVNGHVMAKATSTTPPYHDPANLAPAKPAILQTSGASQPHDNRQPYLAVQFIICVQGIFPSRG